MKFCDKILFILILSTTNFLISQAPSQFTYQSVVRTNSGSLVSNQEVSFRFTVLKGSELGSIVFEEEHTVTTNINGLATMIIGKGSGSDDLSEIDWGNDSYFLKVEVDPEGGFNYIAEDTTQLLSVPYALYSNSSGNSITITGQDYLIIDNNKIIVNKVDASTDITGLATVATTGAYSDLTGTPTIPVVGTDVDAKGTKNSTDVTLSGSLDYITAGGTDNQTLTLGQITNDDLAGSIVDSKLNQITTADKVAGSSVQLASGSALANSSGLNVTVDDSSIENNSGTLRVKANGISNTMIEDQELKEIAGLTPAGTGNYNFIVGTNDAFISVNSGSQVIEALGVKSGTYTWQNSSNTEETLTVSGVVSTSVVVATFKSGDNGRVIKYVTPGSGNITFKLSGTPAAGAKIMYIVIK